MFKSRSTLILAGCMAVAVCTVLLKYYYPSFLYYHTSLLLILLLTIFIKSDFYTYIFGVFAVLMIFLSLKLDANAPSMEGIIKQVSNIFIAVIIMFVVLYIKKLYRSLDKEKRQMNALFEFARESIILTNSKGEIIFGNSEAQRLLGYAAI
jgi:PAS domain-containing protein